MMYQSPKYQENSFKICKHCGMQIHPYSKKCPYCFKSQKNILETIFKGIGIYALICVVIFVLANVEEYTDSYEETLQDTVANTEDVTKEEPKNYFIYEGMSVEYIESKIEENSAGDKCLVLYFDFTNDTEENKAFSTSFSVYAFQNGVEIDHSMWHVNENTKNSNREVQPGTTVVVAESFVLSEDTSAVEIEIRPWVSFDDDILFELEIELE